MKTELLAEVVTLYTAAALNSIGTLSGGGLQTATSGARWALNQTAFSASDGTNTRVEMGNLNQNGISAAGWKFRANDGTGAPIFDSDGLIAVMQQPSGSPVSIGAANTSSLTYVLVTGASVTFTVAAGRTQTWLFVAPHNALNTGAAGNYGYVSLFLDAVAVGNYGIWDKANAGYGNAVSMHSASLSAGSHTIDLRFRVDNAAETLFFNNGRLFAFQLGG